MSDSLGREIDLLAKYPKPKRDISKRGRAKTIQQQKYGALVGALVGCGPNGSSYFWKMTGSVCFWIAALSTTGGVCDLTAALSADL